MTSASYLEMLHKGTMISKLEQPKRGFLKLPNTLLDRILRSNLTGVELKVLLLCVKWTIGYRKPACKASLTALSRCTGHARKFLSNVLKRLVADGFLQVVAPSGFRTPAQYRVPLEWDSPTTVGHSTTGIDRGESHRNGTGCPTTVGQGVLLEQDSESHSSGTLHRYPYIEIRPEKSVSETIPSLPEEGTPVREKIEPEQRRKEFSKEERQKDKASQTVDRYVRFLADVFHDVYGGENVLSLLDEEQKRIAFGIMDKGPRKQNVIINEFAEAAKRARENGNRLPPHLPGSGQFIYILKNRLSI